MDPRDYLASSHQRDYSSIFLNIIKYTLLTILLVSSIYLLTVICVFLFNQDSWIESTTATILSYSPSSLTPSSSLVEDYFNGQGIRFTFGQAEGPNANLIASTLNQINIEIELFQIKSALILVYLAIGFISLLSEDYYISLFFAFTSFIGLLFSLVKRSTQLQFDLIIYSTILSLLSFIYCLLLKLNKPKSTYYYGYLQP